MEWGEQFLGEKRKGEGEYFSHGEKVICQETGNDMQVKIFLPLLFLFYTL